MTRWVEGSCREAGTERCACGTCEPTRRWTGRCTVDSAPCTRWRSVPTAAQSQRAETAERYGCGMLRPSARSAPRRSRRKTRSSVWPVLAQRPRARVGRRRRHDPSVADRAALLYPDGHADRKHHFVRSVAFSPDGKTLASGGTDNTVRLWDVATGTEFGGPLNGHLQSVESVAFSRDGRLLVSGSNDSTVRAVAGRDGASRRSRNFARRCAASSARD